MYGIRKIELNSILLCRYGFFEPRLYRIPTLFVYPCRRVLCSSDMSVLISPDHDHRLTSLKFSVFSFFHIRSNLNSHTF